MSIVRIVLFFAVAVGASLGAMPRQSETSVSQALQQRVAELKRAAADNRARLQQYQWTETTQVFVKGEDKKTEEKLCQYGPNGQVQKTPIGPQPAAEKTEHGLRGRVVEKKVDEMKDYVERLKSLVGEYVPPQSEKIQDVVHAGRASLNTSSGGTTAIVLNDYYKPGDRVTLQFDTAAKKIQSFAVNTYLDDPKNDIVNLTATFALLPDGTSVKAL